MVTGGHDLLPEGALQLPRPRPSSLWMHNPSRVPAVLHFMFFLVVPARPVWTMQTCGLELCNPTLRPACRVQTLCKCTRCRFQGASTPVHMRGRSPL